MVGLLRAIFAAIHTAWMVCLMLLLFWLAALGWRGLLGATNWLGSDPTRDRLYEQGAALPGPDLSPFPPEKRVISNSVGMTLILVPPGECVVGSPSYEEGHNPDEIPHHARITRAFYLGAHEVTVRQFRQFVAHSGYVTDRDRCPCLSSHTEGVLGLGPGKSLELTWCDPGFPQTEDHPVVFVSWQDAMAFCDWLSRRERCSYRLPTEEEWEYACRAGTAQESLVHGYADEWAHVARFNIRDPSTRGDIQIQGWGDGFQFTSPVGSFYPSSLGLHDMLGNVWEWCSDWYDEKYWGSMPADDLQGPKSGRERSVRGGGWMDDPTRVRPANRAARPPSQGWHDVGFRVARDYP